MLELVTISLLNANVAVFAFVPRVAAFLG